MNSQPPQQLNNDLNMQYMDLEEFLMDNNEVQDGTATGSTSTKTYLVEDSKLTIYQQQNRGAVQVTDGFEMPDAVSGSTERDININNNDITTTSQTPSSSSALTVVTGANPQDFHTLQDQFGQAPETYLAKKTVIIPSHPSGIDIHNQPQDQQLGQQDFHQHSEPYIPSAGFTPPSPPQSYPVQIQQHIQHHQPQLQQFSHQQQSHLHHLRHVSGESLPGNQSQLSPAALGAPHSPAHSSSASSSSSFRLNGGSLSPPVNDATANKRPSRKSAIKRTRKESVPDDNKDEKYWRRRKKNNEAAKRSRDLRRDKEAQIINRVTFLERENQGLHEELKLLRAENETMRKKLSLYE